MNTHNRNAKTIADMPEEEQFKFFTQAIKFMNSLGLDIPPGIVTPVYDDDLWYAALLMEITRLGTTLFQTNGAYQIATTIRPDTNKRAYWVDIALANARELLTVVNVGVVELTKIGQLEIAAQLTHSSLPILEEVIRQYVEAKAALDSHVSTHVH